MMLMVPSSLMSQISILAGGSTFEMGSALAGNGVTIIGTPSINCGPTSYGSFSNGQSTNLGITNGVLLTTGSAEGAAGPNNSMGYTWQNFTTLNDPDLTTIVASAVNDVCMFELDVVPQCDSLTIRFIFGSEEYPEYVNSDYNDAFGFFVSGPNPSGGNYNSFNIARLPNNTVISINNVNAGENNQYFVDNTGGQFLQYNGYTTVLSPRIKVVPCQTYHFKLIIGDAGDNSFDSGVLIDFISCTTSIDGSVNTTTSECQMDNGTASVVIDGGEGPFDFNWSHDAALNGPNASNLAPGDYSVEVTDLGIACAEPLHLNFTITEFGPLPTLSLFSNNANPCDGETVMVWYESNGSVTWNNPAPISINGDSAFFVINESMVIDVTATNFCGNTNASIPIVPLPTPNINITADPIICAGSPFILSSTINGLGIAQWTTPNGSNLNGLNINLGAANASMSGWYYVSTSFGACPPKTDSLEITVAGVPTANINNASICLGQSVEVIISPAANYSWNLLEGVTISNNGSNALAAPTINTQYVVTDDNGCSVNFSINLLPLPEPLTSVSTLQGCAPLQVQFTDNTPTPLTFLWNFGDGQTSINESPSHLFEGGNDDTTYFVQLTVTDNNGCSNSSGFFIQTMTPTLADFIANPVSQIYPNATVDFTNNSTGSGTLSAQWIIENQVNNIFNSVSHTFPTWGDFEVSLIITNEWCDDTATQTITILPPAAIANFNFSDDGCPGSTFTFTSESTFAQNITWLFGDGNQGTGESVTHTYSTTGHYDVTLIALGYDGVNDTMVITNAVTIHPTPTAAFAVQFGYLSAEVDSAVFNNISLGASQFLWNFGNGNTSTLFEPNPYYDLIGTYDVSLLVTNIYGCTDETSISNAITVVSDGFIEFPNAFSPLTQGPTDGAYDRFSFENNIFHPHFRSVSNYELEIFNKWGELLFRSDNIKIGWDGYYQGSIVGEDTFVYRSKGTLYGGIPFEKSGTITLLLK